MPVLEPGLSRKKSLDQTSVEDAILAFGKRRRDMRKVAATISIVVLLLVLTAIGVGCGTSLHKQVWIGNKKFTESGRGLA